MFARPWTLFALPGFFLVPSFCSFLDSGGRWILLGLSVLAHAILFSVVLVFLDCARLWSSFDSTAFLILLASARRLWILVVPGLCLLHLDYVQDSAQSLSLLGSSIRR